MANDRIVVTLAHMAAVKVMGVGVGVVVVFVLALAIVMVLIVIWSKSWYLSLSWLWSLH